MGRIEEAVSSSRVKRHVFGPSSREVWTVVGRKSEYWADPGAGFCSCPAYYFGRSSGRKGCYHLDTIRSAVETGRVERIDFADEEYRGFLSGIFAEMWRGAR